MSLHVACGWRLMASAGPAYRLYRIGIDVSKHEKYSYAAHVMFDESVNQNWLLPSLHRAGHWTEGQ